MYKAIKKLFGGIDLTWPKVIIAAAIAGVFTAAMAIIPQLRNTSFNAITVTFEVWILFGIIIIMNSKSNLDSALKCFVLFLISQPLVYLIQVPFSALGWGIFGYYKYWFIWTVLCLPMGFIGYYMKMNKWWGYIILLPMIILTAYSYMGYFSDFLFARPRYILISLFCIAAMILYPVFIFDDIRIRKIGAAVGIVIVIGLTILCLLKPPVYSTEVLADGEKYQFDDTYKVYLEDDSYENVEIHYLESIESYMVHADFRRAGTTHMTLESPTGEKTVFKLYIEKTWYSITEI